MAVAHKLGRASRKSLAVVRALGQHPDGLQRPRPPAMLPWLKLSRLKLVHDPRERFRRAKRHVTRISHNNLGEPSTVAQAEVAADASTLREDYRCVCCMNGRTSF